MRALDRDAPESTKGFLLNPLISDVLPEARYANADPVTGQAAWYDLRVRIAPAPAPEGASGARVRATIAAREGRRHRPASCMADGQRRRRV